MAVLDADRALLHDRPGLLILAVKGYVSQELDTCLTDRGVRLLRPSYRNRTRPSTCSNRSATLKANSTSSCTAVAPSQESPPASHNASSRSPPPSGTTAPPANPPPDP